MTSTGRHNVRTETLVRLEGGPANTSVPQIIIVHTAAGAACVAVELLVCKHFSHYVSDNSDYKLQPVNQSQ